LSSRYQPRNPQLFTDFMTALVKRYGPSGSFWRLARVPRFPTREWQIWNEEAFNVFWASQP
jgi:hypothetical protein